MKKLTVSLGLSLLFLSACGGKEEGGGNAEAAAKTYCECIKSGTPDCMKKIEEMGEGFKKEPKSFDSFREAAVKVCPEAQQEIDAMKP